MSDYIPPELIPNILARLAVDDVIRCTSVCRSWYKLIISSSFASLHLNLSSPNQEPRFLGNYFREGHSVNCYLHRDNQTFDEITKLDPPVPRLWQKMDTINGLVCFCDDLEHKIVLWNPSLRKSLFLRKYKLLSDSRATHIVGFGFISRSNDYKILSISYAYRFNNERLQAEIYQLSTGSWRDVKLENSLGVRVISQQAHLNGILHWSACRRIKVTTITYFICSFDLKNEKYGTLVVPSCLELRRNDVNTYFEPYISRESLSLIDYESRGSCKIWVMKEYGVADSWQNLVVINTQLHGLSRAVHFKSNGEILFVESSRSTDCAKLVCYDCNTGRVNNKGLIRNGRLTGYIHHYVESLALIKVPNEVRIDEESDKD